MIALEELSGGMKNGTCRKFYPSGELLEEAEWQDNRMHGKYAAYFTSGKAFLECHYVNGQRDGTCLGYYPSGAV